MSAIKGSLVLVRAYGGDKLLRRVVADLGTHIVVSNPSAYEKALEEGAEPQGVGFPVEDVSPYDGEGDPDASQEKGRQKGKPRQELRRADEQ